MKHQIIASIIFSCGIQAFGQPVFNNLKAFDTRTKVDVFMNSDTISPGSAGPLVTWKYSFDKNSINKQRYLQAAPSALLYSNEFKNANWGYEMFDQFGTGTATDYFYLLSASRMEILGNSIGNSVFADTFLKNARTLFPLPFQYGESDTDIFIKNSLQADTEKVVYDGYGTLVLNDQTWTNVARIKTKSASDSSWCYYILDPFCPLVEIIFKTNNKGQKTHYNLFYVVSKNSEGFDDAGCGNLSVSVFPNPSEGRINFRSEKQINGSWLVVTDIYGRNIRTAEFKNSTVELEGLTVGTYLYRVVNNSGVSTTGKFVIN